MSLISQSRNYDLPEIQPTIHPNPTNSNIMIQNASTEIKKSDRQVSRLSRIEKKEKKPKIEIKI